MAFSTDEKYMQRCLDLAQKGLGAVAPNPMVGAVIVANGKIIGEGYHQCYGEPHAEPNAIGSVDDESFLPESTLYVNLEPCSHYGKTPPCAELIIKKKIRRVVIANTDPFPQVSGRGIKILRDAGIDVTVGVLAEKGRELNRRFFTFHEKHRPYIILKWAQTADGFIGGKDAYGKATALKISTPETQKLVHQMRANESAIIVGTNTVLTDNPSLTVRLVEGKNPLRVSIDRSGKFSKNCKLYTEEAPTLIFTEKCACKNSFVNFAKLDFTENILPQILTELYERKQLSLIVEGGKTLLQSFINQELWDEAHIEIAPEIVIGNGVGAPKIDVKNKISETEIDAHRIVRLRKSADY